MEHKWNTERIAGSHPRSLGCQNWITNRGKQMLIPKVEKFLRTHEMPATKFGRLAAQDPRFVLDLRMGRIPRPATERRILGWMREFEASERAAQTLNQVQVYGALQTKDFSHAL